MLETQKQGLRDVVETDLRCTECDSGVSDTLCVHMQGGLVEGHFETGQRDKGTADNS